MNVLDEKRSSPELRGYVKERIRKMQDVMARKGVDVTILMRPENVFYFSNFNPILISHVPYFILTRERAEELQGTDYNRLFTSEYSLWKDRVVEAYQWYNETMKPVYGTPMLEHAQLEEGLVRVRYENGYTVYVNYQAEDRECDGVSVPAQSVEVVKG